MKYTRVRFSKEATDTLSRMKGKTGLTPNILCRIGFCLSISDPTIPDPNDYPSDGEREIERQVLTGNWDELFIALFKERCIQDKIEEQDKFPHFRAHMNRGVLLISKRVRSIKDIARLIPA